MSLSREPRERFRELFAAAYTPLHAYARRRADPSDADDIVAEVLTIAWRRLADIPRDAELPWLYGVARNVLANTRRGNERRTRLRTRLEANRALRPSSDDEITDVLEALSRLRPDDQEVLELAAWEGLTAEEIGTALGCSTNAAALRLSRARRRLRATLTETAAARTETTRKLNDD